DEEHRVVAADDPPQDDARNPARLQPGKRPRDGCGARAHDADATPSSRFRPGADERVTRRCRRATLSVLAEPDRPVAMTERVEREDTLVSGLEPLHLRGVAVEQRAEAPYDVAACVLLHRLLVQPDL